MVAFEDLVCGAAAYFDVLGLVEVGGDGFMAPSLLSPDVDYSLDCCFG